MGVNLRLIHNPIANDREPRRQKPFLLDGPMMTTIERRRDVLERMAAHLAHCGENLTCDRDAVRVLMTRGYATLDVAILAGEARMLAYQEIVAREMSKP
jgi:hypothetical protein